MFKLAPLAPLAVLPALALGLGEGRALVEQGLAEPQHFNQAFLLEVGPALVAGVLPDVAWRRLTDPIQTGGLAAR